MMLQRSPLVGSMRTQFLTMSPVEGHAEFSFRRPGASCGCRPDCKALVWGHVENLDVSDRFPESWNADELIALAKGMWPAANRQPWYLIDRLQEYDFPLVDQLLTGWIDPNTLVSGET